MNLKINDSAITRVRLINKVAGDPTKGFNFQIEVQQLHQGNNILALFNPNDTRISQNKPQRAWRGIEPEVFFQLFPQTEAITAKLNAIQPSIGLKPDQMQEDVHYVNLFILNPRVDGQKLGVNIVETTTKPNDLATPKMNPSTKAIVTHGGKPVYRVATVEFNPVYEVLTSDKVEKGEPFVAEQAAHMAPNLAEGVK